MCTLSQADLRNVEAFVFALQDDSNQISNHLRSQSDTLNKLVSTYRKGDLTQETAKQIAGALNEIIDQNKLYRKGLFRSIPRWSIPPQYIPEHNPNLRGKRRKCSNLIYLYAAYPKFIARPTCVEIAEPASYFSGQTTLPVVSTVLFAFSGAIIGAMAQTGFPDGEIRVPLMNVTATTIEVGFLVVGLAALTFLLASERAISAQAWNVRALSLESTNRLYLSNDLDYVLKVDKAMTRNHSWAVSLYNLGVYILLAGIAVAFCPVSAGLSALAVLAILGSLLFRSFIRY
jgi:hypothetical protein